MATIKSLNGNLRKHYHLLKCPAAVLDQFEAKTSDSDDFKSTSSSDSNFSLCVAFVQSILGKEFLDDVRHFKNQRLRVLSLGCGTGYDLLAFVMSVVQLGAGGPLRIHAVGVDEMDCSLKQFDEAIDDLDTNNDMQHVRISTHFRFGASVEQFAQVRRDQQSRFHVILLTFAGIQQADTMQFLRDTVAANLLANGGRIYVIDNDITNVRNLEDFGFEIFKQNGRVVVYIYHN